MMRSLVLNVTNEPLSVVPGRRAALLVLGNRADLIHDSGQALHAEYVTVPVPLVVRLRYFVQIPYGRRRSISRRGVFARDGHRCQYCGSRADSIDHVRPRSRGGQHTWENVVAACRSCNSAKRDRLLGETSMRLRSSPRVPSWSSWVAMATGEVPPQWRPYLDPALTG
jgi:5-methylcytosine-specific restriction endonuclease McrA